VRSSGRVAAALHGNRAQQRFGDLAAGSLLAFFLKEIAPSIDNTAVSDVQERTQMRVSEIDIEVFETPFGYRATQGKDGESR
jgi:hypothetical protein